MELSKLVADRERVLMQIQNLRHEQQKIEFDAVKELVECSMFQFFNVNWRKLEQDLHDAKKRGAKHRFTGTK